jgi:hypothetical protein
MELARPYLPQLELAPPPTSAEIARCVSAERDTLNRGIFSQQGRRLSNSTTAMLTIMYTPTWVSNWFEPCQRVSSPFTMFWVSLVQSSQTR